MVVVRGRGETSITSVMVEARRVQGAPSLERVAHYANTAALAFTGPLFLPPTRRGAGSGERRRGRLRAHVKEEFGGQPLTICDHGGVIGIPAAFAPQLADVERELEDVLRKVGESESGVVLARDGMQVDDAEVAVLAAERVHHDELGPGKAARAREREREMRARGARLRAHARARRRESALRTRGRRPRRAGGWRVR